MESENTNSGACPSFFRAACAEAAQGASAGYEQAGFTLALHTAAQVHGDFDGCEGAMERLVKLAEADDVEGIWDWYADHLPRCAALVPTTMRHSVARGVARAHEELGCLVA
jgi:hypothetical protein